MAFNYKDDIAKIESLLKEILDSDKQILKDLAPAIGIANPTSAAGSFFDLF